MLGWVVLDRSMLVEMFLLRTFQESWTDGRRMCGGMTEAVALCPSGGIPVVLKTNTTFKAYVLEDLTVGEPV